MLFRFGWLVAISLASSVLSADTDKSGTNSSDPSLVAISATMNNQDFGRRTVTFTNGEPAGILQDVVINWATGEPEFGVLKMGDNIHPDAGTTVVPWSLFRFQTANSRPQLLVTKEQLRGAPRLATAKIKDIQDPSILNEARQYYGARGSADSGMSGTLRGSDSSGPNAQGGRYLGAGSTGASVAIYILGALVVGLIAGRYLLSRRSDPHRASAND